jgi:crotonobetainyl-CoA:carnitine CoA-transferase CaiB-like acyl-CoA transferase
MQLVGAAGVPAAWCSTPATYWPSRASLSAGSSRQWIIRAVNFVVRFDGAPAPVKPSPLLGEHTPQVFGDWLGMSAGDVKGLRDDRIV